MRIAGQMLASTRLRTPCKHVASFTGGVYCLLRTVLLEPNVIRSGRRAHRLRHRARAVGTRPSMHKQLALTAAGGLPHSHARGSLSSSTVAKRRAVTKTARCPVPRVHRMIRIRQCSSVAAGSPRVDHWATSRSVRVVALSQVQYGLFLRVWSVRPGRVQPACVSLSRFCTFTLLVQLQ